MNSVENHSLKLTFSNLHCKINLLDSALFAFVIRIGNSHRNSQERYSQGTHRKRKSPTVFLSSIPFWSYQLISLSSHNKIPKKKRYLHSLCSVWNHALQVQNESWKLIERIGRYGFRNCFEWNVLRWVQETQTDQLIW